jgi:hypothetical protein
MVLRSPLLLSFVALALLLVAMEAARPHYFLHDDNACWFAGAYLHDYRVLAETGRLAEVNWYQHGGEPFLQQGQTAVLYPPVYLGEALAKFVSGDPLWAIDWIAAIHLALGLAGFYFWMRQGGVAPHFAALGALAWTLNPFVLLVGASWIFTVIVAAWLPWLFWAFDRLLARPSARGALYLGGSTGLLFLQGYVQGFAYAILFLAIYALISFLTRPAARRLAVLYYLVVALLIDAALALPLLLPMIHATAESALRAKPLPVDDALLYAIVPGHLVLAQFCSFDFELFIALSTAALYCPALLLLPATIFRCFSAEVETRRTLITFVLLGLLALVLCTRAHVVLTVLPVFDRFRWPFKVFLFADFFFLAALVYTAASWANTRFLSARAANLTGVICLAVVVFAHGAIALAYHDRSFITQIILPSSKSPLPPAMNPGLGRTVTFSDDLPDPAAYRYASYAYSTAYAFPSLGGYDPLVGQEQIEFSYYLDYPNFCRGTITPGFRRDFQDRAVRYWIVDARSSQLATIASLPGMNLIERDESRLIFEDTGASPIAFATVTPTTACPVTYSGNSMLIPVSGINFPLKISAGPTDGWWYHTDGGPWQRPSYDNGWLTLPPGPTARLVELTYFDTRFRHGLFFAALLLGVAVCLISVPTKFRAW